MTEQQIVPYRGKYTIRVRDGKKSKWYYPSRITYYGLEHPIVCRTYKAAKRYIKKRYGTIARIVDLYGINKYDYI